jgi:hypothetical protein
MVGVKNPRNKSKLTFLQQQNHKIFPLLPAKLLTLALHNQFNRHTITPITQHHPSLTQPQKR